MRAAPLASSRVRTAAAISRHPLAFCPAHSGEKSPLPWLSAVARSGASADAASGKCRRGAAHRAQLAHEAVRRCARAGRPVKTFVSAVTRAASLSRAARCTALVVASGQSR